MTFVDPETARDARWPRSTDKTAAIIAEPIRGEGGIRPLPDGFVQAVKDVCAQHRHAADRRRGAVGPRPHRPPVLLPGARLDARPGVGRQGARLGRARGRRAGLRARGRSAISAGDHGSTYGGNLLACRAAAFFLEQLMDKGLLEHVREVGAHFERRLRTLALRAPGDRGSARRRPDARPRADDRRDRRRRSARASTACWSTAPPRRVVRLLPPLTIETAEIDDAVEILDGVLAGDAGRGRRMSYVRRARSRAAPRAASPRPTASASASLHCGIKAKAGALDLAVLAADDAGARPPASSRPTWRRPRRSWCRSAISSTSGGRARAVVVNSGCANACTGDDGMADAARMAAETAAALGCAPEEVLVASTGVIGVGLKMDKVVPGIRGAAAALARGQGQRDGARHHDHRSVSEGARRHGADRRAARSRVGGTAKGSGMIEPNMATMLGFLTTDAAVPPALLQRALRESARRHVQRHHRGRRVLDQRLRCSRWRRAPAASTIDEELYPALLDGLLRRCRASWRSASCAAARAPPS